MSLCYKGPIIDFLGLWNKMTQLCSILPTLRFFFHPRAVFDVVLTSRQNKYMQTNTEDFLKNLSARLNNNFKVFHLLIKR